MKAMQKSFLIVCLAAVWIGVCGLALGATPTISWREEFKDNGDQWTVGDTEDYKYEVAGGVYAMTGKKGGRWTVHGFPIRRDSDYILEAKIKSDSSGAGDYAGLIWDFKDRDRYYQFLVSQNGKYCIVRMEGGKANFLVPWTVFSAVNGRGIYNLLRVSREGKQLSFHINGVMAKSLPYESASGESIGFSFSGIQTVSVDSVVLYEQRIPVGEEVRLPSLRTSVFESRLNEKNQSWLVSSAKLSGQFADLGGTQGSGYLLKHGVRTGVDLLSRDFALDLGGDFYVDLEIEWLSGDESYAYGLACDVIGKDYLWFGLAANGFYQIHRFQGGDKKELVPWTMSDNIVCYEGSNKLSVHRKGSSLIFAINGRKVFQTAYEPWSSGRLGLGSGGAMSIRPRFLGIYQAAVLQGPILGSSSYGWGAYRFADGSVYVGFWERSMPNGFGVRYGPGSSVQDGLWKDGALAESGMRAEDAPGMKYFPVMTAAGDLGLVDSWGEELGFGLKGVVYLNSLVDAPAPMAEGGRIGFRSVGGGIQASPEWDLASPFYNGYAIVKDKKGRTGIVDSEGAITLPLGAYALEPGQDLGRGVARFKETKEGKTLYGLVGVDGALLMPAVLLDIEDFREGFALAQSRNRYYGYVDLLGVWRIKPEYDGAGDFSEGLAYVFYDDDFLPWESYIYPSGRIAFDVSEQDLYVLYPYDFSEGLLACSDEDDNLVYLNWAGDVHLEAGAWKDGRPFSEGYAAVKDDKGWRFMDEAGSLAAGGPYRQVLSFSQGLAAVREGELWGYVDPEGRYAIPPAYLEAYSFKKAGFAQVKLASGAWTWIDREGRLLWPGR